MMTCCCGGDGDDNLLEKGGTSSSMNSSASDSPTSLLSPVSVLFPTTTQQYSCTSSSSTGALSRKSFHHFLRACMESGEVTSKIKSAASAPRKNADERLEKRSWPAVSCAHIIDSGKKYVSSGVESREEEGKRWTQICNVTDSSGFLGWGTVFVMKSAPIVALYPVEKRPEMYCVSHQTLVESDCKHGLTFPLRLVLPTPEAPMTTSFIVGIGCGESSCT